MINKTFCAAPWFSVRLDQDGSFRPCCQFNTKKSDFLGRTNYSFNDSNIDQWMTSDYIQYIRESLNQGKQISECYNCWHQESLGSQSLRLLNNNTATNNHGNNINNTWIKLFLKDQNYSKYQIISASVKLSNVCNFRCAMCNPYDSSKIFDLWKSQKEESFVKQLTNNDSDYFEKITQIYQTQRGYQHLLDILNQPIRQLDLLGGEPLIDKKLFEILESVDETKKSKIALHFITNGSQDLVKATNRLKGYRAVSFTVSIEGIKEVQDYIRTGSDWKLIEKNLLVAQQNNIPVIIHHTIQALSILKVQQLIDWCNTNQFNMTFDILHSPDFLAISVLPEKIKQIAINRTTSEYVKKVLNSSNYTTEKYPEFLKFLQWHDRNSVLKSVDIFPELSA